MRAMRRFLCALWVGLVTGCEVRFSHSSGQSTSVGHHNGTLTFRVGDTPVVEGSGRLASQARSAPEFHRVTASQGVQVTIKQADAESVIVEADGNLLPLIRTQVEDGTLHIGVTGSCRTTTPPRVKITARAVEALAADSGASLTAENVQTDRLESIVSSGSSVRVSGRADRQHVTVSSGARFDGGGLVSRFAQVECSSGASSKIHATDELTGSASSGASVEYVGSPAKFSVETGSGASTRRVETE